MIESRRNFFVVTGASGSGKSSIIAALRHRGHLCIDEIGRQLVQAQVRDGGEATPWQDHPAFMELVLTHSMQAFEAVDERLMPVFFDRGIPECIGYSRVLKLGVREHHREAAEGFRYNPTVFFTPPWEKIYGVDAERRHSFEAGREAHAEVLRAYRECGYELVEVPKAPVEERVEFILHHARQLLA
jgi:predicted ATPase